MLIFRYLILPIIFLILIFHQGGKKETANSLGSLKCRDTEDIFEINNTEYILVSTVTTHEGAACICEYMYKGRLALITNSELANFIAVALSETSLANSSVWVGARTDANSNALYWFDGDKQLNKVNEEIIKLIDTRIENGSESNQNVSRGDCLSMNRKNFDMPQFKPSNCQALKPILCERRVGSVPSQSETGSTHPGWIKINNWYFKIFSERINWNEAVKRCTRKQAHLARIENAKIVNLLIRYLLIGRPSLQNAWIGARMSGRRTHFIPNANNSKHYPSRRNGRLQARSGCLLLDRVTSDGAVYIEAHCSRRRPYICSTKTKPLKNNELSKPTYDNDTNTKTDVIIDGVGYRIFYQRFSWAAAKDKCKTYKNRYNGKLVEFRGPSTVNHLLHVMKNMTLAFKHMWIGGTFKKGVWYWDSDKSLVSTKTLYQWVQNRTYDDDPEKYNVCLNVDRENSLKALLYGTRCAWGQYFACSFPQEDFERLRHNERILNGGKTDKIKYIVTI